MTHRVVMGKSWALLLTAVLGQPLELAPGPVRDLHQAALVHAHRRSIAEPILHFTLSFRITCKFGCKDSLLAQVCGHVCTLYHLQQARTQVLHDWTCDACFALHCWRERCVQAGASTAGAYCMRSYGVCPLCSWGAFAPTGSHHFSHCVSLNRRCAVEADRPMKKFSVLGAVHMQTID